MKRSFKVMFVLAWFSVVALIAACSAQGTPAITGPAHAEETGEATHAPEGEPTGAATVRPVEAATAQPTAAPTAEPTTAVTTAPTVAPTAAATVAMSAPADMAVSLVQSTPAATQESGKLTPVTLFLGYIPNIQFAPIYAAIELGYFREVGIDLIIEHGFDETEGLTRIATENLNFGMISGEQVLLARAQGAPVKYVYRWYQRFPVGIVSPAESNLTNPKQLAGKVVGVPGKFGASYIGLQALLNVVGLKEEDLKELKAIGYDTAPIVCDKQVEASVVYIANEPAQIEKRCFKVNVIQIADYANIVSNGLVTNIYAITNTPELVRKMVAAFDRGLAFTIKNPAQAYALSRKFVENLAENDPVQMKVLEQSIEFWKADKLGQSDPESWKLTLETLQAMKLIEGELDYTEAYTNEYLPAGK